MNRETVMSGKWGQSRGNAKSAGTHDMPIPGIVTSRRQPRPKRKAEPARPEPVFDLKAEMKAYRAAQAADATAKRRRKRDRSRRRRDDEKGAQAADDVERSRSHSRKGGSSSSSDSGVAKETAQEQAERKIEAEEAEEERLRKETEERWKAAQEERDARQREEVRLAAERRSNDEKKHQARKQKLKGAFTTGESDGEDEEEKIRRDKAEFLKMQKKALQSADLPMLSRPDVSATPAAAMDLALAITGPGRASQDAIAIRAQLADPAARGNFTPGEVADKYKLLAEMKRKFRSPALGGSGAQEREKPRNRSRSRRNRKSRSPARSRYDSVWIKPVAR